MATLGCVGRSARVPSSGDLVATACEAEFALGLQKADIPPLSSSMWDYFCTSRSGPVSRARIVSVGTYQLVPSRSSTYSAWRAWLTACCTESPCARAWYTTLAKRV